MSWFSSKSSAAPASKQPSEFLPDTPEPQLQAFAAEPVAAAADQFKPSAVAAPTKTSKAPAAPAPQVEMLVIAQNPFKEEPVYTGSFGPFPMRTGSDKLLYGTGIAYLTGISYGCVYGLIRGLQTAQVPNFKVRFNSVLNQTTRYGPWAANSLGVMTLTWSIIDNALWTVRGKTDYVNHISAAFASGVLFKSTAGVRPALITGTMLASTVSVYGLFEYLTASRTTEPATATIADTRTQTDRRNDGLRMPGLQPQAASL
ncbi:Mitochondrial import inner membrane translocase subunit tim23 [Polyrhizophydium stewartii]|uniref:Mitochondrial import inner membrane translocase subunit tim23 n=1 Tax=Polyrhizophydium stewartii TaxID=2732419 RepID=A0ABR4N9X6_9FUNG|nr:Mitochondrial import inner membrane translocase subunit tim23 [Polyrhizophydium stewartii]